MTINVRSSLGLAGKPKDYRLPDMKTDLLRYAQFVENPNRIEIVFQFAVCLCLSPLYLYSSWHRTQYAVRYETKLSA